MMAGRESGRLKNDGRQGDDGRLKNDGRQGDDGRLKNDGRKGGRKTKKRQQEGRTAD
jgi:hypothetical protein